MIEVNCFVCEKSFTTAQMFQVHVENEHSFICDQCNKIMSSKRALEVHMNKHMKKSASFNDLSKLEENGGLDVSSEKDLLINSNEEELQLDNNEDTDKGGNVAGDDLSDSDLDEDEDEDEMETDENDFIEVDDLADKHSDFTSELHKNVKVINDGKSSDKIDHEGKNDISDMDIGGQMAETYFDKSGEDKSGSDNTFLETSFDDRSIEISQSIKNIPEDGQYLEKFSSKETLLENNKNLVKNENIFCDDIDNKMNLLTQYLDQGTFSESNKDTKDHNTQEIVNVKNEPNSDTESNAPTNTDIDSTNDDLKTEYEWTHEDPTVPIGWVTAWDNSLNEKQFMSPKGNFFSGRIAAICYMVQQGTEESQIEEMREGLLDEGWTTEDLLPYEWYVKRKNSGQNFVYFTDDNVLLESTEDASKYMETSDRFDKTEIDNIWKYYSIAKNEDEGRDPLIKNIKQEDDKSVKKSNKCDICGKMFPMGGEWKYKQHIEGHIKNEENIDGETAVKVEGFFVDETIVPDVEIKEEDDMFYPIKVDQEFIFDEEKVPIGWKRKFKNETDNRRKIFFITPEGTRLPGVINALLHMRKNSYSASDIAVVEQNLLDDGWYSDECLPEGWYMRLVRKKIVHQVYFFLTNDFQIFKSFKMVSEFLKQSGEDGIEAIKKISKKLEELTKSFRKSMQSSCNDEDAFRLPQGWQLKIVNTKANRVRKFFITSDGTSIQGTRQTLQYMLKNNYHVGEIELIIQHLKDEGWTTDILLPNGWYMKLRTGQRSNGRSEARCYYLTNTFQLIQSNVAVLDLLRKDKTTPPELIENFQTLFKQKNLKRVKNDWGFNEIDSKDLDTLPQPDSKTFILPENWLIKVFQKTNGKSKKILISPLGERLQGVINALQFMVENKYPVNDIELVAQQLKEDGWVTDELLPNGWYMKQVQRRSGMVFIYLNDAFQRLTSNIAALHNLETNIKTTAEVKINFETLLKRNSLKGVEDGWTVSQNVDDLEKPLHRHNSNGNVVNGNVNTKHVLPENWRMKLLSRKDGNRQRIFIAPDGERLQSVHKALQYLRKVNYSENNINLLSHFLIEDGWERNELLPKGWYRRQGKRDKETNNNYFFYLTDEFERIKSNTVALHYLKTNSNYTKKDINNFITLLNPKSTCEYNSSKENEVVPNGWKLQSIPTRQGKFVIKSPNGQKFDAIRSALKFMYENNYKSEDVEVMSNHLDKEGWEKHELLPKGWYLRFQNEAKESKFSYLSDDFQLIRSNTDAVDILKNNGRSSNEEIENLMTLIKQRSVKATEEKWNLYEENDPLPSGWKLRPIPSVMGKFIVVSPDGTKFEAIRSALRFMVENKLNREDIKMMSKHIIKENWVTHELMPEGWYIKKTLKPNYLTDKFDLLQSNVAALDYLKNYGQYTENDIQQFVEFTKQKSLQGSTERWNWSEGTESIPEGWKIRSSPTDNRKNYVMSPTGMKFDSIRSALQHMAKNESTVEDIKLMSQHLVKELWETNELLPKGWYIRLASKGNEFLTDDFQHVKSNAAALVVLKSNGRATQEDIENFNQYVNNRSWEASKEKWKWSEVNEHIPEGWKIGQSSTDTKKHYVISPNGMKFDSVSSALKYMTENMYVEEDIKLMSKILIKEGWETHDLLPKGWYTKGQYEKRSDHSNYLTNTFERIKSNTVALDVLKNSDMSTEQDVQNLLAFIKQKSAQDYERRHDWSEGNESVPYGWKIRPNPNNINQHYVLSPTGMKFDCVRTALQHMVKSKCKSEDIQIMAKYLIKESWEMHELLPEGWYRRPQGKNETLKKGFNYLTEDFQLIKSNTTALHVLKTNGKSTKKVIQNFIKLLKPSSSIQSEGVTIGLDDNQVVPVGWQIQTSPTKIGKFCVFSPDGVKFESIRKSLHYMTQNNFSEEDIQIMSKHLQKESWETHECLPKGWYRRGNRRNNKNSFNFLSDTFEFLKSNTHALHVLKTNEKCTKEDIQKFMKLLNPKSSENCDDESNWSEEKEAVPNGWQLQENPTRKGRFIVISPDKHKFEAIRSALRFMVHKKFSSEDIGMMSKHLVKENWEPHELLPQGWYLRSSNKDNHYLTDDFQLVKSNSEAMEKLKGASQEDIEKFMLLVSQRSSQGSEERWNWSDEVENMPEGWKIRSSPTDGRKHFVLSPDGKKFVCIRKALQYMAQNGYKKEDIETMSKNLFKENWETNDNLPLGWYIRKNRNEYLTENFDFLTSNNAALEKLERDGRKTDINKMMILMKRQPVQGSEERLIWSEEKSKPLQNIKTEIEPKPSQIIKNEKINKHEDLPNGWQFKTMPNSGEFKIISPQSDIFETFGSALKFMVENNYCKNDIDLMARNLTREGWQTNKLLPKGWYMKSENNKIHKLKYLTDKFELLQSNVAAINALENDKNVTKEMVLNLLTLVKKSSAKTSEERENWSDGKEILPSDWKMKICPTNNKKYLIISPDGRKFEAIRTTLRYMFENNYHREDIEVMAKHLDKEGWEMQSLLPNGWYMKAERDKPLHFLTNEFQRIKSETAALEFLTNEPNCTTEEMISFFTLVKQRSPKGFEEESIKKTDEIMNEKITQTEDNKNFKPLLQKEMNVIQDEHMWTESDGTFPISWKKRVKNTSIGKQFEFFLLPDGNCLQGRVNALNYLVKNDYPQYNIQKMRESLILEGWRPNKTLPENWLEKSSAGLQMKIVSPSGQLFHSMKAAFEYLEKHKNEEKHLKKQSAKRVAEENTDVAQIRKKMATDTNIETSLKVALVKRVLEDVADFEKIGKQSVKRVADEKPDIDNLIRKMRFKRYNP